MVHLSRHSRIFWHTVGLAYRLTWLVWASPPGHAQGLTWVTRAGGSGWDVGTSIAVDEAGNSYVTGTFGRTVTFARGEAQETRLKAAHPGNMFVAKYDRSGRLLWVTHADSSVLTSGRSEGQRLAVDRAGNSYVAGRFGGTVIFGAGEVHETTLSRLRGALFVAKYDRDGRLLWVRQAGGPETFAQASTGLTVDGAGNSYVTGIFEGTALFGAGEAHETTLTAMGGRHGQEIFVAKHDRDGRLLWVRQVGSPSINGSPGLAVDGARNTYIIGGFRDTLTFFGPGEAPEATLTKVGAQGFVAKYDRDGRLLWARQSGGTAIAVDTAGNSYVTGGFAGTVTFGEGEAQETTLTGSGGLLAKYDRNGQLLWARSVRSGGNDKAVMVDRGGDISVIGNFVGSVTFGSINMYETTLHTDGCDIFMARYDASGQLLWARQAGGTGYKYVYGAIMDSTGHSYVTGYVPGPAATFGNDDIYHRTLDGHDRPVGSPKGDIFVAKLIGGAPLVILDTPR